VSFRLSNAVEIDGGNSWSVCLRGGVEELHRDEQHPQDRQYNAGPLPAIQPGSPHKIENSTFQKKKPRRRGAHRGFGVPRGEPVMGRETHHFIFSTPAVLLGQSLEAKRKPGRRAELHSPVVIHRAKALPRQMVNLGGRAATKRHGRRNLGT
jgi:hypothetical protein